jgi:hypothetical protein
VAQHNTSPFVSVMVTVVLLNVALIWAIALVTLRRTFFRFDFPTLSFLIGRCVCCLSAGLFVGRRGSRRAVAIAGG